MDSTLQYIDNKFGNNLSKKTMMFPVDIANCNVNMLNRHTHTKMVVRITSLLCDHLINNYKLSINRELAETIAKLHDIGHTPFGHAGEEALNSVIRYDGQFFLETMPGYFKHNIFSAKIILEEYPLVDWKIVDGVLKHSKIFRNDFNILSCKEYNLIKLNYVFRQDEFSNVTNKPFLGLIEELQSIGLHNCSNRTSLKRKEYQNIAYCKKCGFVCKKKKVCHYQKDHKLGISISSYLTYPYPLTYEGTIVYLADEIASFVSDLSDYFIYLNNYSDSDFNKNIVRKQIEMILLLYESKSSDTYLISMINKIQNYLAFLMEYSSGRCLDEQTNLIDEFINCVDVAGNVSYKGKNKDILVATSTISRSAKNRSCLPLVSLKPLISDLKDEIKKTIYTFIHTTKIIDDNNTNGSKMIVFLVKYYFGHLNDFIKDYDELLDFRKGRNSSHNIINKLIRATKKIFEIYRYFLIAKTTNEDLVKCFDSLKDDDKKELSDAYFNIFYKNISKEVSDDHKQLIIDTVNTIYLREISYLVALFNDTEAKNYAEKYGYK